MRNVERRPESGTAWPAASPSGRIAGRRQGPRGQGSVGVGQLAGSSRLIGPSSAFAAQRSRLHRLAVTVHDQWPVRRMALDRSEVHDGRSEGWSPGRRKPVGYGVTVVLRC